MTRKPAINASSHSSQCGTLFSAFGSARRDPTLLSIPPAAYPEEIAMVTEEPKVVDADKIRANRRTAAIQV
jgi:hypothetical protein